MHPYSPASILDSCLHLSGPGVCRVALFAVSSLPVHLWHYRSGIPSSQDADSGTAKKKKHCFQVYFELTTLGAFLMCVSACMCVPVDVSFIMTSWGASVETEYALYT